MNQDLLENFLKRASGVNHTNPLGISLRQPMISFSDFVVKIQGFLFETAPHFLIFSSISGASSLETHGHFNIEKQGQIWHSDS